jgi:AraC-like DNA-binding protein
MAEDIHAQVVRLGSDRLPLALNAGRAERIYWKKHAVGELEVDLIISGEVPSILNGRPHLLRPGRAYLYLPGDVYAAPTYRDEPVVLLWARFQWPLWQRPTADAAIEIRRESVLDAPRQSELTAAMEAFRLASSGGVAGWQFDAAGHVLRMLGVLRAARYAGATGERDERIALGIAFMERDLARDVSLAEVARAARTTPDYFARLFRQRMGVPPARWLSQRRLQEGRRLLATEPELAIAEIGRRVGLGHASHFARLFQRRFGATPSEFRLKSAWRS